MTAIQGLAASDEDFNGCWHLNPRSRRVLSSSTHHDCESHVAAARLIDSIGCNQANVLRADLLSPWRPVDNLGSSEESVGSFWHRKGT